MFQIKDKKSIKVNMVTNNKSETSSRVMFKIEVIDSGAGISQVFPIIYIYVMIFII